MILVNHNDLPSLSIIRICVESNGKNLASLLVNWSVNASFRSSIKSDKIDALIKVFWSNNIGPGGGENMTSLPKKMTHIVNSCL